MKRNSLFLFLSGFLFMSISDGQLNSGVDKPSMDLTIRPQDNFYEYANGNWLKNNPIPPTESKWGSFSILVENNNLVLKSILEEAANNQQVTGSVNQKLGDFYRTAMDTIRLNQLGASPIKNDLLDIDKITEHKQLLPIIASLHKKQIFAVFACYVSQDLKNSNSTITYISQAPGGLPDKEYYLKTDTNSINLRNKYQEHVERMFLLANYYPESCDASARSVMKMETALAHASMSRVELRDYSTQYNKKNISELKTFCPNINWNDYFKLTGLTAANEVIVSQLEFMQFINKSINSLSIQDWKAYLKWNIINSSAYLLSDKFVQEDFYFNETILKGTKAMKPRWKSTIELVNANLGELLAQAFVEKTFSPESKRRIDGLVDNLTLAFKFRLKNLDWMSDSTKQKALEKLAAFKRKLAYPDKWKDYSGLEIMNLGFYENVMRAQNFEYKRMIRKLGKPVDKTEWGMLPQTVNAYYSPINNEVVFPAAIMQPPFFYANADDAINYGAIGAVIGHELLHGFDDQGCRFDKEGNMLNWWNDEDTRKFNEKTKKLVMQFDAFKVFDDLNVNGELTLGENIADLGGLTMAYEALQLSQKNKKGETIDGFTPEQRFFIGWAQVWRNSMRPEALRQMVKTNVHSPGNYRVMGPLVNLPEFYAAFNVVKGDKMFVPSDERVKIW